MLRMNNNIMEYGYYVTKSLTGYINYEVNTEKCTKRLG